MFLWAIQVYQKDRDGRGPSSQLKARTRYDGSTSATTERSSVRLFRRGAAAGIRINRFFHGSRIFRSSGDARSLREIMTGRRKHRENRHRKGRRVITERWYDSSREGRAPALTSPLTGQMGDLTFLNSCRSGVLTVPIRSRYRRVRKIKLRLTSLGANTRRILPVLR